MKRLSKIVTITICLMLTVLMSGMSAFAADSNLDKADIKYTLTLYSGESGTFSDGSTVKKIENLSYGEPITLSINTYKPVVNSNVADKYYVRGFKIAGHDNDQPGKRQYVSYVYTVTGDESFTVAYGLKGGLVKYTVNYVDANGNTLHPTEEYYGMPGDYPVVSYQYIEGYAPNAYNLGKTLTANEADNVFTFTYGRSTLTAAEQAAAAAQPVNAAANGANAGANGAGNANADGTNIADNQTPAAGAPNVVDLDDGEVPQAAPSDNGQGELSRQKLIGLIIGILCAIIAIVTLAVLLAKRRNDKDEKEKGTVTTSTPPLSFNDRWK